MKTRIKSRFGKNVIFQYGLQIAKYLFPFITLPYLTRVLGPDVYAVRAYILAAMTFMQVFLDYGFTSYGTLAVAKNTHDIKKIQKETSCIVFLRILLSIIGAFALVFITPLIPIMAQNPLYVVLAYIGICFKAMLPDFIFQGLEDMRIITTRYVISQTVATVFIFAFIHTPQDLLWVPAFEGLASLIALVLSWQDVLCKRKITFTKFDKQLAVSAFKESTIFFFSSAATTIFTALTTLMIGILISDVAEVSYWSIAMMSVSAIQSLYTPITNSLYPHMIKRRDFRLFKKLLISGMIAVTIGTIAFAALSNVVMWVLGGKEYLGGSYIIAMVSPVLWFSYPAMLLGFPVLAAVGKTKQLTTSSVTSALFHIAGLLLLAICGCFTIAAIAILRCGTEAVLLIMRTVFVYPVIKEHRSFQLAK